MHATIQKPIEEIVKFIKPDERVFVVGCNNCAWKCHSGGEEETENMAKRLIKRGIKVAGFSVPGSQGMSLCKFSPAARACIRLSMPPMAGWCIPDATPSLAEKPFLKPKSTNIARSAAIAL